MLQIPAGEDFVRFPASEVEGSVPERFAAQVRRHASRPALVCESGILSYAALDRASNRVARAILSRRGERNEPVALLFEHGADAVVALLGILKAGKAFVALDPSYPQSRLAFLLEDSRAELLVTCRSAQRLAATLAGEAAEVLVLEDVDSGFPDDALDLSIPSTALAYLLYTSGSTGRPKGVVHDHRNLLHAIMKYTNALRLGAGDRVTLLPSLSTSAAMSDVFGALLNGASLHPYDVRQRGTGELASWLVREQLTVYHSVPSLFRQLASELPEPLPFRLRLVKLGGEATYRSDLALFRRGFPDDCLLYVALGTTEIHNVRHFLVDARTEVDGDVLPVGYGFEGTEVLVLDEAGAPVAPGTVGEIAVRSAYLTPGYWRRPELTARAFQAVEGSPDQRLYRTGDLGRMAADGCLEVVGRKDFQVKIRGFRVELAEIEALLRQQPGVQDAVVVARGTGERAQLAAYCTPAGVDETGLRRALESRLPDYMLPAAYLCLDALPRTPNGKVDRGALPDAAPASPAGADDFVAPRTPMEELVAGVWAQVLDVERVGVHDDFFERGGHSLMALRVCLALEKALGRKVPTSLVFGARRLEQLAKGLEQAAPAESFGSALVALQPEGSRPPFFFLAGPTHHFGDRLGPDQPTYLVQIQDLDREQHFTRAEEMAANCIRAMRSVQPHGPYYLGGHCFGGIVAFEAARQLSQAGESVAFLALFDSRVRGSAVLAPGTSLLGRLRARARYQADRLRRAGTRESLASVFRAVRRRCRELLWRKAWEAGLEFGPLAAARNPKAANYMARTSYVPAPYAGRVTLFRTTRRGVWRRDDPLHGWGRFARGGVEAHEIPSGHTRMYREPDVWVVVEKLGRCLREAQAASEAPPLRRTGS